MRKPTSKKGKEDACYTEAKSNETNKNIKLCGGKRNKNGNVQKAKDKEKRT